KWYSSSVDGGPESSSTLPKNFLRKPTVLHTAAPVQVGAIPFIDEDSPAPPKPARSFTELGAFPLEEPINKLVQPKERYVSQSSPLMSCTAKPVQLVDPLSSSSSKRDIKPLELTRSSFLHCSSEPSTRPADRAVPLQRTPPEKRYPWQVDEEKRPRVSDTSQSDVSHFREDSGYRSDRKPSLEMSTLRVEPFVSQKSLQNDNSASGSESDGDDGDFLWDDDDEEHSNRFAISFLSRRQM
ncbi:unnamed protein product, partial [Nippostrongylus brasiliensis]|uniref:MCF2L n=1 Tax=Nippostrongylus brasiliensis TaxID=27835 RepID=A0A0N4XN58_NIPBR